MMNSVHEIQIVVDGRDTPLPVLERCLPPLLKQSAHVTCVGLTPPAFSYLQNKFGGRLQVLENLPSDRDVLVVSPDSVFTRGAIRRLKQAATDRLLIRVLVAGTADDMAVAFWSKEFVERAQPSAQ